MLRAVRRCFNLHQNAGDADRRSAPSQQEYLKSSFLHSCCVFAVRHNSPEYPYLETYRVLARPVLYVPNPVPDGATI